MKKREIEKIKEIVSTTIDYRIHCNLWKYSEFSLLVIVFPKLNFHVKIFCPCCLTVLMIVPLSSNYSSFLSEVKIGRSTNNIRKSPPQEQKQPTKSL